MYLHKVIRVAKFKDFPPGSMKTYRVLGRDILIVNVGGILYGLEAECPHRSYPLDLGGVEGRVLKCGFHYVPSM
jgi:nitrite reductase/ring-hydroxylating ferredoxin subunit